jgi:hypothetical protein
MFSPIVKGNVDINNKIATSLLSNRLFNTINRGVAIPYHLELI